ncbi:MAG: OmpA family protein [Bdellovibrionales bacterium]|nr:OmpA family protein [Bdellovibrionales bacterium]
MSSARAARVSSSAPSENRWTLAFAIVMLLLFALCLSRYSLSKKEASRLQDEIAALKNAPPKAAAPAKEAPADSGAAAKAAGANADLQEAILGEARAFLATDANGKKAKEQSDVEVLDLASGDFLVRVAAPNLFAPGSAKVTAAIRPFVDRLGALIVKSGRRLRIEGHADFDDAEAISRKASDYANTWELSAARSAALAQYWMRKFDLDPVKIESAGFGKYRPLEPKPGRPAQANRRIEIVILRAES